MSNFVPKKPVKSFLDLEVYQKSLECAVFVCKYIVPPSRAEAGYGGRSPLPAKAGADVELVPGDAESKGHTATSENIGSSAAKDLIFRNMLPCALGLPHLIAEAHSVRFGSQKDCLILLERAMLHCNKMVVYLEETRDIADTGISWDKFNELIKKYQFVRQKTLNLQRSWKKYMGEK